MVGIKEKFKTLVFAMSGTLAMATPLLAQAQQIGLGPVGGGVSRGGAIGTIGLQPNILEQNAAVTRLLLQESQRLSPAQRAHISQLLNQITTVVLNNGGGLPLPGPVQPLPPYQPGPVQPLPPPPPAPLPPPYRPELRCAQEPHQIMAQTFEIIKDFGYANDGLGMNSRQATDFAQDWINVHACRSAQPYMREVRLLRTYAYSTQGLNMNTQGAINYALQNLDRICYANVDLLAQHRPYYDFAYSTRGLDMNSTAATQYAREKVEAQFLRCNGLAEIQL